MRVVENGQLYNVCVTSHLLGYFSFIMPILLGYFMIPLQSGVVDMLLPRLNNISFWLIFVLSCIVEQGGGTGWTLYYPLSGYSLGFDKILGMSYKRDILSVYEGIQLDGISIIYLVVRNCISVRSKYWFEISLSWTVFFRLLFLSFIGFLNVLYVLKYLY